MYVSAIGLADPPVLSRKLVPRCASHIITVPKTRRELEAIVQRWIRTCVMSRTKVGSGPIHREKGLVTDNPSLMNLWEKVLKTIPGQQVRIIATYEWGANRVESIRFSIPTLDFPPEDIVVKRPSLPLKECVQKALDVLARRKQIGIDLGPEPPKRLQCLLSKLVDPRFDDRFVNFSGLWAYADLQTKAPTWDLILEHGRDWVRGGCDRGMDPKLSNDPDRFLLSQLQLMDQAIWKGIQWLYQQYVNLGSAMSPGMVRIKDWIAQQQRQSDNLYSCYR